MYELKTKARFSQLLCAHMADLCVLFSHSLPFVYQNAFDTSKLFIIFSGICCCLSD